MAKKRVSIVVPGDDPVQIAGSPRLELLEPYGEVTVYTDRPGSLEEKIRRAEGAEILINSRGIITWGREEFSRLPKLKMITSCSIGTDMFDLDAAREHRIVICNQPGRTAPVVAEHVFGLMFAVAKRAAFMTSQVKDGNWPRMDNIMLQGKVLGVLGTGNIGAEMIRLAKAVGMKVIAWTYHPSDERAEELGVEYVDFDTLLKTADVVSLHVRLSVGGRYLIGKPELDIMKPGAVLLNGARGAIVDTEALADVLNSGHLSGAGIDVYDEEPISQDNPLLSCEQVVLTPHCADMTPEGVDLLNSGAVENIIAYLQGRPINRVV